MVVAEIVLLEDISIMQEKIIDDEVEDDAAIVSVEQKHLPVTNLNYIRRKSFKRKLGLNLYGAHM